jgi:hypothetical protein
MAKVKVYRFKYYDAANDREVISTRMATREKIESLKTLWLIPETEAEIDSSRLIPGEKWTATDFVP